MRSILILSALLLFNYSHGNEPLKTHTPPKPYLKYKVPKDDWILNILRRLRQFPLYGKNGSLEKTIQLNPQAFDDNGNYIKGNTIITLPITEIPVDTPYIRDKNQFILRVRHIRKSKISKKTKEIKTKADVSQTPIKESSFYRKLLAGSIGGGFILGLSGGKGVLGNEGVNFTSREITVWSGHLLTGLTYEYPEWKFLFGPIMEFKFINQNTQPTDGLDTQGIAYDLGAAFALYKNNFYALFAYISWGRYDLGTPTDQSELFEYFRQPAGTRFAIGYFLKKYFSLSLSQINYGYTKNKLGDYIEINIDKKLQLNYTNLSLDFHY